MTKTKLVLTASVGALIFGVAGYAAAASEQHGAIAKHRTIVAADDSAAGDDANSDGSAKTGAGEGTYVGEDQGSAPESDTDKIDQPARRNPTTSNAPDEEDDDVMPPDESGDADQPE